MSSGRWRANRKAAACIDILPPLLLSAAVVVSSRPARRSTLSSLAASLPPFFFVAPASPHTQSEHTPLTHARSRIAIESRRPSTEAREECTEPQPAAHESVGTAH